MCRELTGCNPTRPTISDIAVMGYQGTSENGRNERIVKCCINKYFEKNLENLVILYCRQLTFWQERSEMFKYLEM